MKLTRNAINLAIKLIVLSSMINLVLNGLVPLNSSTSKQDWGDGNIFYLDRQNVACPEKSALDGFKLYRPTGNTLAYKYSCRKRCSGMKTGKTYVGKTKANATDGNKKRSAHYLDRHYVKCRTGYALRQFKLGREGNNIFYSYTCTEALCKSRPTTYTSWSASGDNQVIYLDRQTVSMQSHHVITGFKLESKGGKFRYRVDYCMLKHPARPRKPVAPKKPVPRPVIRKPVAPKLPSLPKLPKRIKLPSLPKLPKRIKLPTLPKLPKRIKLPSFPKVLKMPKLPTLPAAPIGVPAAPIGVPAVPIGVPAAPIGVPAAPIGVPAVPTGAPAPSDITSAPLDPNQAAANAKGKAFCLMNCDLNPASRLKKCLEDGILVPCKRCTNKPIKSDPSLKQVCELVCNAHLPNKPCDFYGYLNNAKKAYSVALLAKFGLKILRKYFKR